MRRILRLSYLFLFTAMLTACAVQPGPGKPIPGMDVRENAPGQKPSIEAMARYSDFVVVGHVGEGRSYWRGKKIYTDWTVEVVRDLKGQAPKRVQVTTLGGAVPPLRQYATHTAQLESGETAVLFLARPTDQQREAGLEGLTVLGGEYGVITLIRPGQAKSRLQHNRRLVRYVDDIADRVRRGE